MTILDNYAPIVYTGNGATTSFPFSWAVQDEDEIVVLSRVIATRVDTTVPPADYSVVGTFPGAGSVTYEPGGAPLPATHKLVILRDTPKSQDMDITAGGGFFPTVLEQQLDAVVMTIQELEDEVSRATKVAPGETPIDLEDITDAVTTTTANAAAAAASANSAAASAAQAAALAENGYITGVGAVGDGVTDDTAAFTTLEGATVGLGVNLLGLTYKVDALPDANDYYNGAFKVGTEIYRKNRNPRAHPFENPIATVREIDPVPFIFRGLNVALFEVGTGDQVVAYREAPGHGNENEGTRYVSRITDDFAYSFKLPTGPGNAGPVETEVYYDTASDTRNSAFGKSDAGTLMIIAARVNSDGTHNDPVILKSTTAGASWTNTLLTGLTGPTWNFHSKIQRWPAGGAQGYIAFYYTTGGIGAITTTDEFTANAVDLGIIIAPGAGFASISEMSVARIGSANEWVMGIRTGSGQNMAVSKSTDLTTWAAIVDSGLKLGANPLELFYEDGKVWVLAFSRRDKPIITEYENAVVISGVKASTLFATPTTTWEGWKIVSVLQFFPTGYVALEKIRDRFYALFSMENYAGSTQSDTGTLMMLSSDTLMKSAQKTPNPNIFVNGALRQWPMGTTLTGTTRDVVVPGMTFGRTSSVGGWTISRQTGQFGPYSIRIQRDDADAAVNPMIAVINLPLLVSRALAGEQVTVSMRARKGGGFSAANNFLTVQLRQTSHTTEQAITAASGSFTTGDTAVGTSSSGFTLTGNWQRFSLTPGRIAADTYQICLRILWTPVGVALDDYIDIEEIKIERNDQATRFVYEDLFVEKQRCSPFAQNFTVVTENATTTYFLYPDGQMHVGTPTITPDVGTVTGTPISSGFRLNNSTGAQATSVIKVRSIF